MAEKRIVVPEEMLKAAIDRMEMPNTEPYRVQVGKALEAALRWLYGALETQRLYDVSDWKKGYDAAIDDVRRMFLSGPSER